MAPRREGNDKVKIRRFCDKVCITLDICSIYMYTYVERGLFVMTWHKWPQSVYVYTVYIYNAYTTLVYHQLLEGIWGPKNAAATIKISGHLVAETGPAAEAGRWWLEPSKNISSPQSMIPKSWQMGGRLSIFWSVPRPSNSTSSRRMGCYSSFYPLFWCLV